MWRLWLSNGWWWIEPTHLEDIIYLHWSWHHELMSYTNGGRYFGADFTRNLINYIIIHNQRVRNRAMCLQHKIWINNMYYMNIIISWPMTDNFPYCINITRNWWNWWNKFRHRECLGVSTMATMTHCPVTNSLVMVVNWISYNVKRALFQISSWGLWSINDVEALTIKWMMMDRANTFRRYHHQL
jgi:hypothetical protein